MVTTFKRHHVEVQLRQYSDGWLATLNVLDGDEVDYGCTGDYGYTPYAALASTIEYFNNSWLDSSWPAAEANSILNELGRKEGNEMKYWATGEYADGTEFEKDYDALEDAQATAGTTIENGGFAHVTDDNGNEYPIF